MLRRFSRFWVLLWLCSLPISAHAEFVNQVDGIITLIAILLLGIPLVSLLLYLLIHFLKR